MNLIGHAHDVLVADPRGLRERLRLHRRARGMLDAGALPDRQVQHGRVRVRLLHRELGVRPDAQPVGPRARAGRLVGRLGGARVAAGMATIALGQRHRRLDPPARRAHRHRRDEADVRARLALRRRGVRQLARPDRAVLQDGRGVRAGAQRDLRQGPDGRDVRGAPGRGLHALRCATARRACASASCATCSLPKGCDPRCARRCSRRPRRSPSLGAEVGEVDLPHAEYGLAAYYIIGPAEASSNLARFDGIRYGHRVPDADGRARPLHALARRGLRPGEHPPHHARHVRAVRRLLRRLLRPGAEGAHAHHPRTSRRRSPTSTCCSRRRRPTTAFKIGEKADDPLAMYLSDIYTIPVNLAGIPGVSIPCGLVREACRSGCRSSGRTSRSRRYCGPRPRSRRRIAFDTTPPVVSALAG